jgi:long-chain acyl-CoA synthetase
MVWWLITALFNVFPLPKLSGFRQSFAFAGESADHGYSVLVFPEGARTRTGKLAPFQHGIGLLVANLHLPVVPIRIDGLWELKQMGRRGFAPWRFIQVHVGAPVRFPAGTSPEQITKELERMVALL